MTSKERVRAAFNYCEPDRVPVFEIHIDSKPGSEILGHYAPTGIDGRVRKMQNEMTIAGESLEAQQMQIEARMELCRKLELDIIRAFPYWENPPVPKLIAENTWRFDAIGEFNPGTFIIDSKGDDHWSVYRFEPLSEGYMEVDSSICHNGIDELKRLVDEMESRPLNLKSISFRNLEWVKETAPDLCAMGWADVGFVHCSWMPVFLETMAAEPEVMDRWRDAYLRDVLLMLEAQLQRGADLILGGQDFCDTNGPMISPRHYERFIQPGLKSISEMCHRYGIPYLRHNDGNLSAVEKQFLLESGIDGWHAIEPAAGMDIFYFKENYGKIITLAGNIDCARTLVYGTPEDIRKEVREKIRRCAPGGGYIISSSNSIHNGISGSNYLVMREAIEKYGCYPIDV